MRFWIICFSVLFLSLATQAQMAAFVSFDKGFSAEKGSEIVLDNLPPVTSQDSIGQCAAWAATAMMQINNCRIKNQNCQALPEEEKFSPLDIARFSEKPDGAADYESSYRGLQLDGGPAANILERAALLVGSSASEACMSLDKILGKLGGVKDTSDPNQENALSELNKIYQRSQKIDKKCETCLAKFVESVQQDICQKFNLKSEQVALMKAFSEETYNKFIDDLFSPKECKRAKNRAYFEGKDKMEIKQFPSSKKDQNYEAVMKKIKSVLDQKLPVMISGICAMEKTTKNCIGKDKDGVEFNYSHATTIVGFARMCDPGGKCYDALKIQNSWGKSWQNATNDGWIAANELFQNTPYSNGMLTWLQDKSESKK